MLVHKIKEPTKPNVKILHFIKAPITLTMLAEGESFSEKICFNNLD